MELIYEGVKLTIIGMTIVYVFLILLMVLIMISAKIFKRRVELQKVPVAEGRRMHIPIPIISAAIAAYRSRRKQ
jgi:Na+-transporting methylmalonyl-CoA/oxaloacetate decarboxylase gamma subunit